MIYLQVRKFSAESNLPPKAILLLDNCSAHAPIESLHTADSNIIAMLLPPNVTAVVQPMDQNPIKITKLKYRNMFLTKIVAEENVSIHDILQKHTIRDAVMLLKSAWDDLPRSVLQKSWSKILNWDENQFDEEDNIPLSDLIPSYDIYKGIVHETQQLLLNIATDSMCSLDDIEEWNDDIFEESDMDVDVDNEEEVDPDGDSINESPPVAYSDALTAVNTLIKRSEHNKEYSNKHIANLIELRTDIVRNQFVKPHKQTLLTNFFSPTSA